MKKKIFLDFDLTTANSVKAYCRVYNELYKSHKDFTYADYTKVNKWDFSDECPMAVSRVESMFELDLFFYFLEVMNKCTLDVLKQLEQLYDVVICSIGTPENISKKVRWIDRNLGIKNMILLSKNDVVMDKSIVDMSGGILIDDHEDNLFSSNADIKICFGEVKSWNKNWQGLRVKDWTEVGKLLINNNYKCGVEFYE